MNESTTIFDSPQGPIRVRPYRPGDESSILELFELVFDVKRDPGIWNWQFRDGPVGVHSYVGQRDDGEIVSQFCSIPVRVRVRDRDVVFGQMVDSMVHPSFRGSLKKKGLFATTVDTYVERYGHLEEEVIMMGLPNPEAYRIGKKLCGYVPMIKTYLHRKPVIPDPTLPALPEDARFRHTEFTVRLVDRFGPDHDEFFARLAPRHFAITHRDALHLNWRYADNPQWNYTIVELRTKSDGVLQGYAVTREDWLEEYDFIIADWFVDADVPGACEALESSCVHLARRANKPRVYGMLNPMCSDSRFFEDLGYVLMPTRFRMVSRTYAADFVTPDELNHHWYYTMGDFDVV